MRVDYPLPETKGTSSQGPRHGKAHGFCPRCGRRAFHIQTHRCASCAYPNPKMHNWAKKALRRRSTGTGSMSHLREVQRRWKNHFREGIIAKPKIRTQRQEKQKKVADPAKKARRAEIRAKLAEKWKQRKAKKNTKAQEQTKATTAPAVQEKKF